MKKLLLLTTAIAVSILTFAQPSQGTMTAKIKGDDSSITSVEFIGNGEIRKEYDDGAWHNYFYQSYKSKSNTDYPGITYVYSGVIRYENNVFNKYLIGDSWYEGVPDPDKSEILEMLNADLIGYFHRNTYNEIVGEVSEITFPEDPEYHWHTLSSVSFLTKVTYSEKISYTKVRKAEHTIEVRLYSDGYKEPWKSFNTSKKDENQGKDFGEIIEYTQEEMENMKTLAELDAENAAKSFLASLPEVKEPPVFQSDKQLFYYIHEKLMTEETEDVKAHLYKVMDKSVYEENSTVLLKSWAQGWYDKVTNNHDAYKTAHCMYPTVKAYQDGMITFYDRENRRMLRITGSQADGTWKLTQIDFHPANSTELERMKDNDANCGEKPDLAVQEIIKYEIGDCVEGKFRQGWLRSTITKKDTNFDNRYYVKADDGSQLWMTDDLIRPCSGTNTGNTQAASYKIGDRVEGKFTSGWYPGKITKIESGSSKPYYVEYDDGDKKWMSEVHLRSGSGNNNTENIQETTTTQPTSFKVGDKVIVKTTQGDKKGKIIKYASHKYLVKFTDPRLGDTWCKPGNLEHQ